jgi:hypothetical protein
MVGCATEDKTDDEEEGGDAQMHSQVSAPNWNVGEKVTRDDQGRRHEC